MQSKAIVHLCHKMDFRSLGIIYVKDTYGTPFNLEILRVSTKSGIHVNASISYSSSPQSPKDTHESIQMAVKQLKASGALVTILIVHARGKFFVFGVPRTQRENDSCFRGGRCSHPKALCSPPPDTHKGRQLEHSLPHSFFVCL